jgi:predicted ATPase/DNA-binding winged helix-turn-helix (wHTH) protein
MTMGLCRVGAGGMKQFAAFRLDTANECLWHDGVQIALPPRPFMVLRYLVENPGRLITHDELLDALWPETYVQPQVLRTYMLDLRKVLGDDAGQPRFIQTLPKRGYCFVAPVSEYGGEGRDTGVGGDGFAGKSRNIVGRDEELSLLQAEAKRVEGGQRRVVFVTGEAGIGKSALVDAFCHRLDASWSVARGQCVEGFGGKEEYYPVMEALGQLCASADGERVRGILARMAPAWLTALGRQSDEGAPTTHERMPGDLCGALEQIAEGPLMLVLEDLHWADDSTLNLLSALARRRAAARLMVVATCGNGDAAARGAGEHPLKGLKQNLLMRHLCTEMALAPLSRTAVKELLARELEQDALPPGLTGFVHQHSEGNPLFAIAILEHLIARQFLVRAGTSGSARWEPTGVFEEMEADVPERLAQMIELEIEGLSADEQRILGAGSAMGIAFPAWAVAAALEEDAAEIEEACAGLARRLHFVERGGQDELPNGTRSEFYVFVHGLYREVLYRRQAAARRATWHARIAERLGTLFAERMWAVAREMAMHFEAAGERGRAVSALQSAARCARDRQEHNDATQLLEEALRMAEKLGEHARGADLRAIREELEDALETTSGGSGRLRIVQRKA